MDSEVSHPEVAAAFEGSVVIATRAEVEGMLAALHSSNGIALRQLDVINRLLDKQAGAVQGPSYFLDNGSTVNVQSNNATTIHNQYLGLTPGEVLDLLNGLHELARRLDSSPTAADNNLQADVPATAAVEQRDSLTARGVLGRVGTRLLDAAQEVGTNSRHAVIQGDGLDPDARQPHECPRAWFPNHGWVGWPSSPSAMI